MMRIKLWGIRFRNDQSIAFVNDLEKLSRRD
jgi:hypothetical protein